ncbi:GNAT family N-acetyltransferase [Photobacterium sanguinicancri]|uniref:GNAT family N-acetyltransferase n=1 Tax=Photobacterium sanguinicancri TaxID=875932 RepID=UPI003D0960F7
MKDVQYFTLLIATLRYKAMDAVGIEMDGLDITNNITCEWSHNPSIDALKLRWRTLEKEAKPNLFISWCWIGPWLDTMVDDFWLLTACTNGQIVGLAIFTKKQKTNWLGQNYDHYFLHRLGNKDTDQIWIEYNDFLLESSQAGQIREVMFQAVQSRLQPRDCVSIGASSQVVMFRGAFEADHARSMIPLTVWESPSYQVDLQLIQSQNQTAIESLSKSARKQIRRSIKKYECCEPIKLETAKTCEQALVLFDKAKHNHLKRWGGERGQSGFANPVFVQFHQAFIRHNFSSGLINIHGFSVDDKDIGIIYNFHFKGVVYFYLSSLAYNDDPQLKPGLVAHYLLIEQALKAGMKEYDFMGGEARYKQTFANRQHQLAIIEYHQPHFALSLQNMARGAKRLIVQSS